MSSDKSIPYTARVKCRKCRHVLLLITAPLDEKSSSTDVELCCDTMKQVIEVDENSCVTADSDVIDNAPSYPQWIATLLDEGGWCSGKLRCPHCSCKVGAFSFVSGNHCSCAKRTQLPSVYFLQRKVDLDRPRKANKSVSNLAHNDSVVLGEKRGSRSHQKSFSWSGNVRAWIVQLLPPNAKKRSLSVETCTCDVAEQNWPIVSQKTSTAVKASVVEESKATSENEVVDDDLPCAEFQCAVCLELLCVPRVCHPCAHMFCEPCVKMLRGNLPSRFSPVKCALCRTLIHWTTLDDALECEIRCKYPERYAARLKWYREQLSLTSMGLPGGSYLRFAPRFFSEMSTALSAMFLSMLCLVMFFCLFIPGVYISTSLYDYAKDMDDFMYSSPTEMLLDLHSWLLLFLQDTVTISFACAIGIWVFVYIVFLV